MKFYTIFIVTSVSIILAACSSTATTGNSRSAAANGTTFRIPANDYRKVDCRQLAHLIGSVEQLRQKGTSLNKAYEIVTPKDASPRAQIVHMVAISGFYHALGGRKIDQADLRQLESICTDTGIAQSLIISTNMVCHTLAEGTPLIRFLQNKKVPLQSTVKRTNTLVQKLPLPIPDNYKLLTASLPGFIEGYVSTIYSQPDKSSSQLSDEFITQCAIEGEVDNHNQP